MHACLRGACTAEGVTMLPPPSQPWHKRQLLLRGSTCLGHVTERLMSEPMRVGLQIANQDGFQQVAVSYHEALLFFMTTGG